MATTIAVLAAGAAVAGTATSAAGAAQSGKGGSIPQIPIEEMGPRERKFMKDVRRLLTQESRVLESALSNANLVEPEIFRLLGFEPIFEEGPAGDVEGRNAEVRALNEKLKAEAPIRRKLDRLQKRKQEIQSRLNVLPRPADQDALRKLKTQERRLKKKQTVKPKELRKARKALSEAQTVGRRVVGLKPLEGGPRDPTGDPEGRFLEAFNLQNESLLRALRGEEPIDATLRTEFEEREALLRERLRRQLGSDFETSSAGIEALRNFDREKAEAFSQFNREVVNQFSVLTNERAGLLSDLTGARISQLLSPATSKAQLSALLGDTGQDRLGFLQFLSDERQRRFDQRAVNAGIVAQNEETENRRRGATTQAIGSGLSGLGSGLFGVAGGGGLSGLLGGGSITKGSAAADRAAGGFINVGGRQVPNFA